MTVIVRGARVRIPKGTPFAYATAPKGKPVPTHARISHDVIVQSYDNGQLWWAGPGGYWRAVEVTPELLTLWGETQ